MVFELLMVNVGFPIVEPLPNPTGVVLVDSSPAVSRFVHLSSMIFHDPFRYDSQSSYWKIWWFHMVPLKEQQAPAQGPALAKDQLQTLLVRDTTFELILGSPMAVPMECQDEHHKKWCGFMDVHPHNISTYGYFIEIIWSIITFPILWWTSIWGRARHISSFAPKPGCFCRWWCWSWWCLWPSKLLLCFAFRCILLTLAVRFFWGGQTNST